MNETSRVRYARTLDSVGAVEARDPAALHLPECATEPAEVYELAKRRGMDFVTITDHDTIAGALELGHLPDTFVSEELTVWFKGEPQAVHVLCYGITPEDHEWLQAHNDDVEACAAYLHEHEITSALAHPFYAVQAPLTARHRRRLAAAVPDLGDPQRLARQGAQPAGVRLHRDPRRHRHRRVRRSRRHRHRPHVHRDPARPATRAEFLAHVRAGRAEAHGAQGSAAKWAHAAMALAIRALGGDDGAGPPDPSAVLTIVERVMREGDARHGERRRATSAPRTRSALLRAWLRVDGPATSTSASCCARLQDGELSHPDLQRRARRIHERKLAAPSSARSSR